MPKNCTYSTNTMPEDVKTFLDQFPGDTICPLQVWYEGLGAYGVPSSEDMAALTATMNALPEWRPIGTVRYEKYGNQQSYYRKNTTYDPRMVQHCFKPGKLYKEPDGTILKVAVSEVYNLRCFEIQDGHMVGKMIKIHPQSDRAKALVEVAD